MDVQIEKKDETVQHSIDLYPARNHVGILRSIRLTIPDITYSAKHLILQKI